MMSKRKSTFKPCLEILRDRLCPSTYSVVDLGTLGGTGSVAEAINQSGQVAGQSLTQGNLAKHAFLWQNGAMTDLGTLGGTSSDAMSINKSTQVVGKADTGALDASGNPIAHAYLWQNAVMTDLGTLGGTGASEAYDINSSGQVVGGAVTSTSGVYARAFVWQNGVMTDLNSLLPANSGWVLSSATGINDNGQITGVGTINGQGRAYLFSSGAITNLGNLGGPGTSIAQSLNNSGQVVGIASASSTEGHAFLYSGGVMTDLGTLTRASQKNSQASDINSSTQVVGWSSYPDFFNLHAFLWQHGTMTDLNKMIPTNSGWVLGQAFGINDTGYIVGGGTINSQHHAFLLKPPALTAASTAGTPVSEILRQDQVQPLVTEAQARWQAAGADTSGLGNIQIQIADLGGNTLGLASGHTITLDDNAAGWGWFVDPTPRNDSEFTTRGNQGEQHRMDLLTVLQHEIGHLLGHDHDESGVMAEALAPGERWTLGGVYVGQGVGTILDDEPRISINNVTEAEGKKGQTTLFTFPVTLSVAYDQAVTMSFRTVDGTAESSDGDYVAKTGALIFAPGETTKTITIEVKGDSKRESNETFDLDLYGLSINGLFTKNRGLGTILNDD